MSTDTGITLPRDVLANPRVSRWVAVSSDGTVDVRVGKVELGQGILTALAQVAADGLGVRLRQVRMLAAHTDLGPDEGLTAGSMSVFDAAPALRVVTAFVRGRFVAAAAGKWGVDPAAVAVADGVLTGPGGERASFGELA
ncbi:MAG TPA: molybdopterin cofactor-binding domain-containing protein, partial [Nocardioidaceae bacterium]